MFGSMLCLPVLHSHKRWAKEGNSVMSRGVVFPLILGTLTMGVAPQDGSWPLIHCQLHCLAASTSLPMNNCSSMRTALHGANSFKTPNRVDTCSRSIAARPPLFRGCVFVHKPLCAKLQNLFARSFLQSSSCASSLGTCRLWPTA